MSSLICYPTCTVQQRRFLLTALVTVCVGMLLAYGGGGGGTSNSTSTGGTPDKGAVGYLEQNGQPDVWVSVDEKAQDELLAYCRQRNEAGVRQMIGQGRVLVCAKGTKVSVVDPGFASTTVRILEGQYAGQTGIVANEDLHKWQAPAPSPPPQVAPKASTGEGAPQPAGMAQEPGQEGRLSAEVVKVRLEPFRTVQGRDTWRVYVDWKNTGDRPVRAVIATTKAFDAQGNELVSTPSEPIYVGYNDRPGVAPGATFVAPPGEGGILPPLDTQGNPLKVARVTVKIDSVSEKGIDSDANPSASAPSPPQPSQVPPRPAPRQPPERANRVADYRRAERESSALLSEAKRLIANERTRGQGKKALAAVIDKFPDTVPAKEARSILKQEEAKNTVDERAEPYLRYAKKLIEEDMTEKAKERLQEIIQKFPPSKTREEARKLLEELGP